MENNSNSTGEMGDHLPIKRTRQDQSSSKSQLSMESPVAAKPLPKDTNWADLFVKEFEEIANASDLDDAKNRADKLLKSFEAFERAYLIPKITEEPAIEAGSYKGPLPFVPVRVDTESEDEDEETVAKEDEKYRRLLWGIDENGQMPEHFLRELKRLGMNPCDYGHIDKQSEDMDDGDESKK